MEQTIHANKNKEMIRTFITEAKMVYLYGRNDMPIGKGTHWISTKNGDEIQIYEKFSSNFHNITLTGITEIEHVNDKTLLVRYEDGKSLRLRNVNE